MFSRSIIILALGCALSLAQAAHIDDKNDLVVLRSGISETFTEWFYKAKTIVQNAFSKAVEGFQQVYEKLTDVPKKISQYSHEKFEKLITKYHDIKLDAKKKKNEIEKAVLLKIIAELESIVKYLTVKVAEKTAQEVRELGQKIAEKGKETVANITQEMQGKINEETEKVKENFGNWKNDVDGFLAQNKVDSIKEKVGGLGGILGKN